MARWVYDIVRNQADQIVAVCYHQIDEAGEANCLGWLDIKLIAEGLSLGLSDVYDTLEEARASAWQMKDQFHPSLD
jgi:hypothetical protein